MKRILPIILFILLTAWQCDKSRVIAREASACGGGESSMKTDTEKFGLKEEVAEWMRECYGINDGKRTQEKVLLNREIYRFNRAGMILEMKGYEEENTFVSCGYKEYDEEGNITEERYYDASGTLLARHRYYYNEAGRLTRETKDDRTGKLFYSSCRHYDCNGNVTGFIKTMTENDREIILTEGKTTYFSTGCKKKEERTEYAMNGAVHFRNITHYDTAGRQVKVEEYNGEGNLNFREEYTYNGNGNLTRSREYAWNFVTKQYTTKEDIYTYDAGGKLLQSKENGISRVFHYDEAGSETDIVEYSESGTLLTKKTYRYHTGTAAKEESVVIYGDENTAVSTLVNSYNAEGNLIEWARFKPDGSLLYRHRTYYDDEGNTIEEVHDATKELPRIKYRYSYDEQGNHIETRCYRLDDSKKEELALIYHYEITYRE
ncbi:MAG: hypothetical protein JW881_00785 [Spirochaetales bacterium]|nr:hypothetical protein [Spirochaetales bacterium]